MIFNLFSRSEVGTRPQEGSFLHSQHESSGHGKDWSRVARLQAQVYDLQSQVRQLREILVQQPGQDATSGMHPFKLYHAPRDVQPFPDDNKAWRMFRVRDGKVMLSHLGPPVNVDGTDGVDLPYDDVYRTKKDGTFIGAANITTYEVPNNSASFYFWVEIAKDGSNSVVRYGNDPSANTYIYPDRSNVAWNTDNNWASWDQPDDSHHLLAVVDTATLSNSARAIKRQYQVTDIMAGGGGITCPY